MGTENSSSDEWIELYNTSSSSIDLTNWTLEATDGSPFITLEGDISAGKFFLLERTNDDSVPDIIADQIYTGALGNSGEYLKLKDSNNNIIEEINCSDGWFAGDNSTKQTMERTTNGWQTSLDFGGTPKAQNSSGKEPEEEIEPEEELEEEEIEEESEEFQEPVESSNPAPVPPAESSSNQLPIADAGNDIIAFTDEEITFDGSGSYDPDNDELNYNWNLGEGTIKKDAVITHKYLYSGNYLVTLTVSDSEYHSQDTLTVKIYPKKIFINEFLPSPIGKDAEEEWIEIYNDSEQIINIDGWQLDDEDGGSKPFIFPKNTLIAPKDHLVFSRQTTKIALNNDKDSVRLLLPSGMVFQEINYEKAPEGQSSSRTSNGFVWSTPTPGMPNKKPLQSENINYSSKGTVLNTKSSSNDKASKQSESTKENQLLRDQFQYNLANTEKSAKGNSKLILIILTIAIVALAIGIGIVKLKKNK